MAPAYTSMSISTEEPRVTLNVTGKKINFLVDTGATLSSVHTLGLSSNSSSIIGVEG